MLMAAGCFHKHSVAGNAPAPDLALTDRGLTTHTRRACRLQNTPPAICLLALDQERRIDKCAQTHPPIHRRNRETAGEDPPCKRALRMVTRGPAGRGSQSVHAIPEADRHARGVVSEREHPSGRAVISGARCRAAHLSPLPCHLPTRPTLEARTGSRYGESRAARPA